MAAKAFKALILGPPGGGKGTLSKRLVRDFGFCHFSAGDALRAEISAGSAIGNQAKDYIGRGALVPDELVTDLVLGQLENLKNEPRWLLDGFPRHAAQALALDAQHDVDLVLDLDIPEAEILSRLGDRRVHVPSGRSYHVEWNPPKQEGIDDETGEPLVVSRVEINLREPPRHRADVAAGTTSRRWRGTATPSSRRGHGDNARNLMSTQVIRPDDTEEAIKRRLQQYHDLAKPLIEHYGAKVATFAGTESDVIYPVMKQRVEAVLG